MILQHQKKYSNSHQQIISQPHEKYFGTNLLRACFDIYFEHCQILTGKG